ncbi:MULTISPECIES: hypothetical protein [Heyndrickxia]|uniref:Uncharacterized protein n=1 Tax=Heyndrickxia coagulans 36D1 TaxID=345219 RepID=G2TK47_HEYCO|nr:hypothetical protein [Heyndrickxia coagulans]AEP01048.1 hypothetical protein Bcoa_1861 [Heyndrickxia coagulans 36D1]AWP38226.1 hypothetical protein CYJ15_15235 [Heyndrickxia coagulans]NWN94962.1 hypothetical protein [Bacillus sp. (in: firmicutes)]QDI60537.1 hypothetical protein DXF96_02730 [Heyndrickxia coagulans]
MFNKPPIEIEFETRQEKEAFIKWVLEPSAPSEELKRLSQIRKKAKTVQMMQNQFGRSHSQNNTEASAIVRRKGVQKIPSYTLKSHALQIINNNGKYTSGVSLDLNKRNVGRRNKNSIHGGKGKV